jgi:hypothetical protein
MEQINFVSAANIFNYNLEYCSLEIYFYYWNVITWNNLLDYIYIYIYSICF